jgi:beta-lactamase regulating signal transducer with metallopeptidase domain
MNVSTTTIAVPTSEKVPNPMLVGFKKPVLFLPHEEYFEVELEFIIKHELVTKEETCKGVTLKFLVALLLCKNTNARSV